MKCAICKHGQTQAGEAMVTLQRDGRMLVFKSVPADICENCGEYYLSAETATRLYQQAEQALQRGAEIEIGRFLLASA